MDPPRRPPSPTHPISILPPTQSPIPKLAVVEETGEVAKRVFAEISNDTIPAEPFCDLRKLLLSFFKSNEVLFGLEERNFVTQISLKCPPETKPILMRWLIAHLLKKHAPFLASNEAIQWTIANLNPLFFDLAHYYQWQILWLINNLWKREEFHLDLSPFATALDALYAREDVPRVIYTMILSAKNQRTCSQAMRELIDKLVDNEAYLLKPEFNTCLLAMIHSGQYNGELKGGEGIVRWLAAQRKKLPPEKYLQLLEALPLQRHSDVCHGQLKSFLETQKDPDSAFMARELVIFLRPIYFSQNASDKALLRKLIPALISHSPFKAIEILMHAKFRCPENGDLVEAALQKCSVAELIAVVQIHPEGSRKVLFPGRSGYTLFQRLIGLRDSFFSIPDWLKILIGHIVPLSFTLQDGVLELEERDVVANWITHITAGTSTQWRELFEFLIHFNDFPYFYTLFAEHVPEDLVEEALYIWPDLPLTEPHAHLAPLPPSDELFAMIRGEASEYAQRLLSICRSLSSFANRQMLQKNWDLFLKWVVQGAAVDHVDAQRQIDNSFLAFKCVLIAAEPEADFSDAFQKDFKRLVKSTGSLLYKHRERRKSYHFFLHLGGIAKQAPRLLHSVSQDLSSLFELAQNLTLNEEEQAHLLESLAVLAEANPALLQNFSKSLSPHSFTTITIATPRLRVASRQLAIAFNTLYNLNILPPTPKPIHAQLQQRQVQGKRL